MQPAAAVQTDYSLMERDPERNGALDVVLSPRTCARSTRPSAESGSIAGATSTWATVAVLGVGVLLAGFAPLATALRLSAAAHLVWVGLRMVLRARDPAPTPGSLLSVGDGWAALHHGHFASTTNPKAVVFFGSIFVARRPGTVA